MRAGGMKYRVALLEPVTEKDLYGSEKIKYVETRTVHAERVSVQGNRSDELGEHFPDYSVKFNIRDIHHIAENWRCRQLGGELFTIVAIIPNINRGFNTLICERVNE